MFVKVTMKDGRLYEGIKCGSEGGFLYMANAYELAEDDRGGEMPGNVMACPVGEKVHSLSAISDAVRIVQLPIADVDRIESVEGG